MGTVSGSRPLVLRMTLRIIPHLALIATFFIYLILGALLFTEIEGDQDDWKQMEKDKKKLKEMMEEAKNCTEPPSGPPNNMNKHDKPKNCTSAEDVYDHMFKTYEDKAEWKIARMQNIQANRSWEFYSSMLFCVTTITTIGEYFKSKFCILKLTYESFQKAPHLRSILKDGILGSG